MMHANETSHYFERYVWNEKHFMFGYKADTYRNGFPWIRSLESRFQTVTENPDLIGDNAPIFLIREMIKWGSSHKRDISPKFDDYIGSYCLAEKLTDVIESLANPARAINAATEIPGLGPTYASKLLRFLQPENYGALDDRIYKAIADVIRQRVSENNGRISDTGDRFCAYIQLLSEIRSQLPENGEVDRPIADIEMALFQWSTERPAE